MISHINYMYSTIQYNSAIKVVCCLDIAEMKIKILKVYWYIVQSILYIHCNKHGVLRRDRGRVEILYKLKYKKVGVLPIQIV